jgi:hypothetical protein
MPSIRRATVTQLDITRAAPGAWDILLAQGRGVGSGEVTYRFWFETSFAQAGYVAPTVAENGRELVVFNWSPVQWDEAERQQHYTLKVLTPHPLPPEVDPRAYVETNQAVLTEPWVNQKFRIDYQRGEQDRLRLLFHRDRPGNRFDMRIQVYLPAEWFNFQLRRSPGRASDLPTIPRNGGPPHDRPVAPRAARGMSRWTSGLGAWSSSSSSSLIAAGKQRSMVTAHQGLRDIRWENLDWTPPKLVLSNFTKPGKVCEDLTPLEAAFYLGLPFKRIVSGMLNSMALEGWLEIQSESPLRVRVRQLPDSVELNEYERLFFDALADDGELSQSELERLMNTAIANIREKAWDADVSATQRFYRDRIDAAMGEAGEAAEDVRDTDHAWYWWYHNRHPAFHRHYHRSRIPIPTTMNPSSPSSRIT